MSTQSGFDISSAAKVASQEDGGRTFQVRDPNNELMFYTPEVVEDRLAGEFAEAGIIEPEQRPVTITVVGTYSARYRRAQEAQRDKMIRARRTQINGEVLSKNQTELLAACVIGWDGFFNAGRPLACTKENVIAALERAPWLQAQVDEEANDHAAFFGASSTS